MKSMILVALALVAVAVALPVDDPTTILRSEFNQSPEGGYNYVYETSDGSKRQETGEVKQVVDAENKPQSVVVVRGTFSYVNPDGVVETISYSADENGYQATGDSIPKPARR